MSVWVDLRLLTHVSGVWQTLYILSRNFAINHKPGKSILDMDLEHTIEFTTTSKIASSAHSASDIQSSKEVGRHFQESTRYSIILHPYVYHLQNDGYTRALTYMKETDLEICISGPSTLIQFLRGCQFHPVKLQNQSEHRTWHPLQRCYEYICDCISSGNITCIFRMGR